MARKAPPASRRVRLVRPGCLRATFDIFPDAVLILDEDGRLLDANRAACERYGYSRSQMRQMDGSEIEVPHRGRISEERRRALKREGTSLFETVHRAKDGTLIPTEVHSRIVRNRETTFIVSVCRDITERAKADDERRRSASLLEGTLDSTTDGILVVDDHGRICTHNRQFLELWRIPEDVMATGEDDKALSRAIGQLKDPEAFLKKVRELYVAKDAQSFDVLEFKDGRILERYSIPLKIDGKSVGRVWSFRDVTGRERMEDTQRIFTSLVENSTDLIGIASLDGRIQYLNKAGRKLVGLESAEEVRRARIRDFARRNDLALLEKMLATLIEEGIWKGEVRVRNRKTAASVPLEMNGLVLRDHRTGQPIALASICRDISERKKMEEEMARADKLTSIGILAGGIAHDFNNLLTAILGNISLAKMFANRNGEVYARLQESERAAQRARDLTQQLLTFSRGGAPVKKTILVEELVKESANFVLRGSGVRCEISIPPDLPPLDADEGQLSQVLNNLLINAAHAMHGNGTVQVHCGNTGVGPGSPSVREGEYVVVSIMDHGMGISRAHLSKIFDPYFTTKKKGSGLGLSTSYSIVRNHGGYIGVDSTPGIGSTFQIYLPASKLRRPSCRREEAGELGGRGRILVMDDEEAVRDVAESMLESLGYSVVLARDGEEAIEAYREAMASGEPFDSVIMDLTIPGGMGGLEAVRKIKGIDSGVKAIVCSGYSNDTVMANYRAFGFCGVIPKPYSLAQLGGAVREVLSPRA